MKKILLKIGECILVYIAVILVADLLFSFIYYNVMMQAGDSFRHVYVQTISGKLKTVDMGDSISLVQAAQNLLEVIATAILTGYVMTYFTRRQPKVSLVDYLVIRRRTSENVREQLSLGVIVLNKSRKKIENVKCHISCVYVNLDNKSINAEYHNIQDAVGINNFMRFSFPLELLPHKLMRDFINRDEYCRKNDAITITLTGEYGSLKSPFKIEKRYKLKDIVIVSSKDLKYKRKVYNLITGKEEEKVQWDILEERPDEASQDERNGIMDEIEEICEEKL